MSQPLPPYPPVQDPRQPQMKHRPRPRPMGRARRVFRGYLMVVGALANSHAQIAVAVSGTAGPSGGTPDKPVGTACFAWAVKNGEPKSAIHHFPGDREAVRQAAVRVALEGVLGLLPAVIE